MRHTLTVLAAAVLFPAAVIAQTNATKAPVDHNQVVSTNPFGAIVQWYNGEYERKISPTTTVGASASHFVEGELSTATALARWYPQRAALDGFYLGARAGAYRVKTQEYEYHAPPPRPANPTGQTNPPYPTSPTYRERTTVAPAVGLEIGYNWLLGPNQNVSVGIGVGVTRTFGNGRSHELPPVLPSVRLVNIGYAF